jgi:hypothetical protein
MFPPPPLPPGGGGERSVSHRETEPEKGDQGAWPTLLDGAREIENISRDPTFGDFCHYPHRGVDAGRHGFKNTEYKSTDTTLPPLLNVMYCVRVSLWTVKIFLAQH